MSAATPDTHTSYLRDLASRIHLAVHEYRSVEDAEGRLVLGDDDGMRLGDIAMALAAAEQENERLRGATIRAMQTINAARSVRWMAGSPGWTTLEIAGELAGEVGELANVCKKLRRSEMGVPGNKLTDAELRERARGEIADVLIVLMLTASKLGIDLHDAVVETFNRKSEQMGFPERLAAR